MKLFFIDFETYYSKEFTLRTMTPIEYILDPRYETLGLAVKEGVNSAPYWVSGGVAAEEFFKKYLVGYKDVGVVSHNALFDAAIMAWRYSYVPGCLIDTLGMARALLGHKLKSLSLDSVSQHMGFGKKGDTLQRTLGVTYGALLRDRLLHEEVQTYACDDVEKCALIFKHLIGDFPADEITVMDMVIKATVLPQFKLNRKVLEKHLWAVLDEKRRILELTSVLDAKDLRSNDRFAELLRGAGVDPPMKTSPTTGKETYAFAKTDSAFIDLAEHEDPGVQALVAARLGHKTSLEETRTQRLLAISNLHWPVGKQWMPIPLRYSGAHTHRLSGDMKLNMQNLPRKSALRKALMAPMGSQVVSIDLSQIEARIVAWLCEQSNLVEAFAAGDDVYSGFAEDVFHTPVTRKVRPDLRFIGKTAILGLGYGMSWRKFLLSLKAGSKSQTGSAIELSDDIGQKVVTTYRAKYFKIAQAWNKLNSTGINALAYGGAFAFGPCEFRKGLIRLPNEMNLYYHDLEQKVSYESGTEWTFTYGGRPKHLYGAKVLENITQALARIVIMDLAMRALPLVGRFAHQVHDELIYVVKNNNVEPVRATLLEMSKFRPTWAPDLPLAAEVKFGPNYGDMI